MKLKKTLSAFGVLTVAVAALATGPAAAFAADDSIGTDGASTSAFNPADQVTGKMVMNIGHSTTSYWSSKVNAAGEFFLNTSYTTLAAAEAASDNVTIPKVGKTGPIVTAAGKCAVIRPTTGNNNRHWIDLKSCTGGAEQNWYWDTANGEHGLRQGTNADRSYMSYAADTNDKRYAAGMNAANFVTLMGSAVVEEHLALETPGSGSLVRESKPTFSGTGDSGATIEVLDENGDLLTPTTTVVDGKWSVVPTADFAEGRHIGTVRQVFNGTPSTVPFDFTYRTVQGVSVTSPALDGTVDVARPVFSGKGEPGAQVTIATDSDQKLVDTTVDVNGDWSQQSILTLPKGKHEATATQVFEGNPTTAPVRFTYGAVAPVTPITLTSPGIDEVISDKQPTFKGKGQPGAEVTVRGSSGKVLGTATVNESGDWAAQSTIVLGDDKYTGTATQVSGTSTTSASFRYEIKSVTHTPVKVTAPALDGSVATSRPVFEGTGTPGASIEVKGNSGKLVASGTVNNDGKWAAPASFDLNVDSYIATAFQNAAGTMSQAPIRYSIVSSVKVATPVKDSTVNTKNPVFSGTGAKGATIVVKGSSGAVLGTTEVKADGTWSVPSGIALGDGEYIGKVFQTINGLTVSDSFRYFIKL